MRKNLKFVFFLFFFVSGFCGLLYQVVWVRLAYAAFGVTSFVLSSVISAFMLGIASGSRFGARIPHSLGPQLERRPLTIYGLSELGIAAGALAVPALFSWLKPLLHSVGGDGSSLYFAVELMSMTVSLFPWCFCMGATIPIMMGVLRGLDPSNGGGFSLLYFANVLGAMAGVSATAGALIELFGFKGTLLVGCVCNLAIGLSAIAMEPRMSLSCNARKIPDAPEANSRTARDLNAILFMTGLTCLAMEVIWTRNFAPILGTQVYSFALLLLAYLFSTAAGSAAYRLAFNAKRALPEPALFGALAIAVTLPVVLADPRIGAHQRLLAIGSIVPFNFLLGYLTPHLIDKRTAGDPSLAGRAYAWNTLGCIAGPLIASFTLEPAIGAKASLLALSLPYFALLLLHLREDPKPAGWIAAGVAAGLLAIGVFFSVSYEDPCSWGQGGCHILRDHVATVVFGGEGRDKILRINGKGITALTPATKYMAHLPLAVHQGPSESALAICFGMGTTYRSLLSWNVRVTAVELVPSVKAAFPFFYDDAQSVLANRKGQIVIDDGRRFLEASSDRFDVITIDPPPPLEAAGSSLLLSDEFQSSVKEHLAPGGVFQLWVPGGESLELKAILRSTVQTFSYVRAFRSVDNVGLHILASSKPLDVPDASRFIKRMPETALKDLSEWSVAGSDADVATLLESERSVAKLLSPNESIRITDDHPFNEYFWLRRELTGPLGLIPER